MNGDKFIKGDDGVEYDADDYAVGKQIEIENSGTFGGTSSTYEVQLDEHGSKYWALIGSTRLYDSR